MKSALKRHRKKVFAGALCLLICAAAFTGLSASGVFSSREITSVSVTYDADPYNEGQSDPHTYEVSDTEDILFLQNVLSGTKPLRGGAGCPFKQIVLHVTYSDGSKSDYYPACDSCNTIAMGDPDNSDNHYEIDQNVLFEFRQRISRYVPDLSDDSWWLNSLT